MSEQKLTFETENGEMISLFVLEETRISGKNYILAAEDLEGDGECYIFKDTSAEEETEAVYEPVEDEAELEYLMAIFSELLDDVDIQLDKD